MTTTDTTIAAQASLAAALRQVLNQTLRLLEERDPASLLANGGNMVTALSGWRKAVAAQTSSLSVQRSRELEDAKLQALAKAARLEKEAADLRERNAELLAEIVRLNKREEGLRQQLLDLQFARDSQKAEAKRLDLEVRDLHRRIRELEGGPPLKPSEAAPRSTGTEEKPAADEPVAAEDDAGAIATRLGMSNARSAVEAAFSAMWKPKEASDEPAPAAAGATKKKAPAKKKAAAKEAPPKKKAAKKKAPAKKKTAAKEQAPPKKKAPAKKKTAAKEEPPPKKKPTSKKKAPAKKKTSPKKKTSSKKK